MAARFIAHGAALFNARAVMRPLLATFEQAAVDTRGRIDIVVVESSE